MFPAGVSYGESRKIESTLSDTQVEGNTKLQAWQRM
nr:MAG TPA: hypothetical protein [Caudoviricetes sp.]